MKHRYILAALIAAGLVTSTAYAAGGYDSLADKPVVKKKIDKRKSTQIVDENDLVSLSDKERLRASKDWEKSGQAEALVGVNGQVEYPYGHSRPTIVCAPLHLCTIQLIDGENITNVAIGDTVRWMMQQASAASRPVIVVKPTQAGLSTNMTITTDMGRVYYMNLVSSKSEYVPLVGFYDPQKLVTNYDNQAEQKRMIAEQARQFEEKQQRADEDRRLRTISGSNKETLAKDLDFKWSCVADNSASKNYVPAQIFSSKGHVYIKVSGYMKDNAPAIFNATDDNVEILNYRVSSDDTYVVDGNPGAIRFMFSSNGNTKSSTCTYKEGNVKNYTMQNQASQLFGR